MNVNPQDNKHVSLQSQEYKLTDCFGKAVISLGKG